LKGREKMTSVNQHQSHDHDGVPPLPPSPTRQSRFHFFSVPENELESDYDDRQTNNGDRNALLKNEKEDISRRRHIYKNPFCVSSNRRTQQHYHQRQHIISYRKGLIDIQRQVAAWHSRFAQEILDRNQDDCHHIPFTTKNLKRWNGVMDRMYQQMNQQFLIHNDNETHKNYNTSITSATLQQRMDRLDSLVRQLSDNITSITSSRNTIHDTWTVHTTSKLQQAIDEVHTLQIQSNKREEQMYARLYHIASLSEASWAETNAQRYAQLTLLKEKVHNGSNMNQAKRQGFLAQIQKMKDQIRHEREERMKRDREIIDMIVNHRTMLEKVMMLCLDL
jgi:hypothetical protein